MIRMPQHLHVLGSKFGLTDLLNFHFSLNFIKPILFYTIIFEISNRTTLDPRAKKVEGVDSISSQEESHPCIYMCVWKVNSGVSHRCSTLILRKLGG